MEIIDQERTPRVHGIRGPLLRPLDVGRGTRSFAVEVLRPR